MAKSTTKTDTQQSMRDFVLAGLADAFKKDEGVRIRTADDVSYVEDVQRYQPTGIDHLDFVLTNGHGIPCGRMVELFGKESSGKTAMCEYLTGVYTRAGGGVHYLDYEECLDDLHLATYQVNRSLLFTPDLPTLEQGVDYTIKLCQLLQERGAGKEPPSAIFVDSVAAACPRAELEDNSIEDNHMALVARAMARGCRKLIRPLANTDATVFFVNQIRDVMNARPGQKQTKTPGGWALKFAYSIRLELYPIESIKNGNDQQIGQRVRITTEKNKLAPKRQTCEVMLSFKRGIDADWSNFEWYKAGGFIDAAGSRGYRWKGMKEAFLRRDFGEFRAANADKVTAARDELYEKERKALDLSGLPGTAVAKKDDSDDE